MRSYDPPPETDDLTAEQAQRALNRMHADALTDKEHPYFNGNHPQHKDFVDYFTSLHTILATDEADRQDAAAQQALEDARAETGDLTPAECLARGKMLMRTKGYLNGSLPPEERAKLAKEIDALYLVGCQQEPSTPEEMETDDDA